MFKSNRDLSSSSLSDFSDVTGSDEEITWIEWFCHLKGNEFFVEVDEFYIQDEFNLTGLAQHVPYYDHALNLILDYDDQDEPVSVSNAPLVETAAQMLYGLIHQRFILTTKGMQMMMEKYQAKVFGPCPNAYCDSQDQAVLPSGSNDLLRHCTTKVFCPRCQETYIPKSTKLEALDGAYFGTSFAHLFFLTYSHLVPQTVPRLYVPRIYGFKVHKGVKDMLRKKLQVEKKQSIGDVQNEGEKKQGEEEPQQPPLM